MCEKTEFQNLIVLNYFGDMPCAVSGDNTKKIHFCGYLLNRKELQTLLELPAAADPELMLAMYQRFGADCVKKVKGMFSFVIQDQAKGSLFMARDRVGGKPLYYALTEGKLVAAPDLKAILREKPISCRINKEALAQYLMLSYIPAPLSILENVYKLPAAHCLTVTADGHSQLQEYWDIVYDEKDKIRDYDTCKKELKTRLFQAVADNLEGESSAGILLSGGIDSNIITGITTEVTGGPVDTFSIGYKNVSKDYDESDRAILSAKFHKSNHQLFYIEYQNMLDNIEKVIGNIDEPYADSSYLPTYTISQIAGEHVKTVLTGDAGDELFAGYNKYLIGHYSSSYKKIPGFLRKGVIEPIVGILPANKAIVRKMRKVIDNSFLDTYTQRRNVMCLGAHPDMINQLLTYDGSGALDFIAGVYEKYKDTACETDRTLYTDFKVVLEGDMLPKADRSSTLAGVVSKAPILHPDVVELAAKIPVEYKIHNKNRKIILKETFIDYVPAEIVTAKKKGFSIPVANWFQNELKEDLLATLNPELLKEQGLLNPEYVQKIVDDHLQNRRNYGGLLWALYVFEKWYLRYFSI